MIQSGKAAEVVQEFLHAYLVQRNIERASKCLTEDIHWNGKDLVIQALRATFSQVPYSCRIEYDDIRETSIAAHCAVVLLAASVFPDVPGADALRFEVTATCVEEGGLYRIASIHASAPDALQEEAKFFPSSSIGRAELDRQLGFRALDILGKSIPGGMIGGYLEPGFPLYYVNDFLLSYLGYTYDEFNRAINGMVINCIHPDDRKAVDEQVAKAFSEGSAYEIQYRMKKKNGDYIWVNDIGKKGLSEDGRKVCISVIRDISLEVESREGLERQARRYNHLFESVLCGIVQYKLTPQGVIFINANREAIRIFGYTPEEFWAKKNWDLTALIASEDRVRILKEIETLQAPGDKSPYEYRLLQKGGTPLWIIGSAEVILDIDGEQVIQSVFLDIDSRKRAELSNRRLSEQLEASNEILHLALEHTTTCEFYYYPQTRECLVPPRTCSIYHCQERYGNMPYDFATDQVDPAYHEAFYKMYECISQGEWTSSCEFLAQDGVYWCRVTLSVILANEDGSPQLVIGITENITHQKEIEAALIKARSQDELTGLYNKESGIQMVKNYLAHRPADEHGVMMLLDMDNFKEINQKEGNVFADALLLEVADILRAESPQDSISMRLGGDEFMFFVKNSNKAQASVIGPRIARQVQSILATPEKDIHVSVSIGMCSTEVTGEYHALYRCAESTLKYVKEHGKGQAACYLDTSNELGVFLTQLYTDEHPVNAIEPDIPQPKGDFVAFALDLLGKAKNLDDAVFLLLSRIGKLYHFDRVSIIEANPSYLSYHFSYQWARSREDLQLGCNFYAAAEDFDACATMYDEEGLADHNVKEGISRFPSCLHAGIWNYGEYAGSMSFEVDRENYQWTPEQRKLLKEMVKIVPSFIMKSKADAVSQAKTDFLSRMSHEIRTPMNAISGMTTIAKSVLSDREKTLDCLEKIESANTYLLGLINDILDMSRIESGKLELNYETVDLSHLLSSLESLFRAQATEKGLLLRIEDMRVTDRCLIADSLRLNQVLVNIIGNAIKFTSQGSVTLRVEELETSPKSVLKFSVQDTGIGIEASAMERIFNAFEQADSRTASLHGGTGLGLSISRSLVQMMGGTLEVQSQVGKGSLFYFTLSFEYALASASPMANSSKKPSAALPDFHGYRILLAEDNELNQEIAQTILEMNGFTVCCANDGRKARDLFVSHAPGYFDAILMDIRMPVMDGLESTRCIRTSGRPDARTIPILALTANAFDEDLKKSMESGMNGHLSKPIQVEELLELLSKCIRRNSTGS